MLSSLTRVTNSEAYHRLTDISTSPPSPSSQALATSALESTITDEGPLKRSMEAYQVLIDQVLESRILHSDNPDWSLFPPELRPGFRERPSELLEALNHLDESGHHYLHRAILKKEPLEFCYFILLGTDLYSRTAPPESEPLLPFCLKNMGIGPTKWLFFCGAKPTMLDREGKSFVDRLPEYLHKNPDICPKFFFRNGLIFELEGSSLQEKYLKLQDKFRSNRTFQPETNEARYQAIKDEVVQGNVESVFENFQNYYGLEYVYQEDLFAFNVRDLVLFFSQPDMLNLFLEPRNQCIPNFDLNRVPSLLIPAGSSGNLQGLNTILESSIYKKKSVAQRFSHCKRALGLAMVSGSLDCAKRLVSHLKELYEELETFLSQHFSRAGLKPICLKERLDFFLLMIQLSAYFDNEAFTLPQSKGLKGYPTDNLFEAIQNFQNHGYIPLYLNLDPHFKPWEIFYDESKFPKNPTKIASWEAFRKLKTALTKLPAESVLPFFERRGESLSRFKRSTNAYEAFTTYLKEVFEEEHSTPTFSFKQQLQNLNDANLGFHESQAHCAVLSGSLSMLKWVHQELKLPVTCKDLRGITPLKLAQKEYQEHPSQARGSLVKYLEDLVEDNPPSSILEKTDYPPNQSIFYTKV